ncbi:condensation domain-containing protein, partial [Streptomyces sp. NPDC051940]|uniref:condensation domain-containing protein n=1 Tax=Streptomyces sp. NPDC051940 TaxID=3155675 RepID=UPI00341FD0CD
PADRPAPPLASHRGRTLRRATAANLGELARSCAATRFAVQLAAAATLIARHSGNGDVVVGVPLANRDEPRAAAVGCLVTVVPVRIDLDKAATVRELVGVVRDALAASMGRAGLPLDELVSLADAGRRPLFDVAVADHGRELPVSADGLVREVLPVDRGGAAFDLSLLFGRDSVALEYGTDRFDDDTAARYGDRLVAVLRGMVRQPDHPWTTLPIADGLPSYEELRERAAAGANEQTDGAPDADREPSGRFEEAVADAFGEVLGYGPVAAGDDFFDFGGHSLAATQVAGRLEAALAVEVTVRDVYEASTVAALARRLQDRAPSAPALPPIRRQPRRAGVSAR